MLVCADRIWNGVDPLPLQRGYVEVQGGVIRAVGKAAEIAAGADRIDLGDVTLLPGLINAHVHLVFSGGETVVDDFLREKAAGSAVMAMRAVSNMDDALSAGVTTVRDLGGPNDVVLAARDAVRSGVLAGPDVLAAGEGITSPGGHCWFFGIEATDVESVRAAVKRQHAAGTDLIKIFATGGHLTPNSDPYAPQFGDEAIKAVVDEAGRLGMHVSAHAHATEGIRRSADAGVRTIEHCTFSAPDGIDFDDRVAEQMAESGIRVVPTPGASTARYMADPSSIDELPEARREPVRQMVGRLGTVYANFRRMREIGVEVIAGSDAGITNRRFGHFPADLAVYAIPAQRNGMGLGNHGALVAATSGAASGLGLSDRGTLARGKRADLLAVEGNPLDDIADLTRTAFVMCGGRVARNATT